MINNNYPPLYQVSNCFVNADGWPYLSGEYINRDMLQSIDRSLIQNQLVIDNNNPYHSVVDIVVDNVGECPVGNQTQYEKLLQAIAQNVHRLAGQLDVVRRNLKAKVYYQVESERSGRLLKNAHITVNLDQKDHYLNINTDNIQDSAIISNSYGNSMATIATRVTGSDRMVVRLTSLQLFYVRPDRPVMNPYDDSRRMAPHMDPCHFHNHPEGCNADLAYAKVHQPKYSFGPGEACCPPSDFIPNWKYYTKYYHYENNAEMMVLHENDIYDPYVTAYEIPCGRISLNRAFIVNTSMKMLVKVSLWKNDVVMVDNTKRIADILGVVPGDRPLPPCDIPVCPGPGHHGPHHPPYAPNIQEQLMGIYGELAHQREINKQQCQSICDLKNEIKELHKPAETPDPDPGNGDGTDTPTPPEGDNKDPETGSGETDTNPDENKTTTHNENISGDIPTFEDTVTEENSK